MICTFYDTYSERERERERKRETARVSAQVVPTNGLGQLAGGAVEPLGGVWRACPTAAVAWYVCMYVQCCMYMCKCVCVCINVHASISLNLPQKRPSITREVSSCGAGSGLRVIIRVAKQSWSDCGQSGGAED